jgi:hypothetical protein
MAQLDCVRLVRMLAAICGCRKLRPGASTEVPRDPGHPRVKESAGKQKGKNTTGHGNTYLARVLGNAAVAAGKTDTFLGERYRRIPRRRGRKKAVVVIGRSLLAGVSPFS